jgi:hypothetical protein
MNRCPTVPVAPRTPTLTFLPLGTAYIGGRVTVRKKQQRMSSLSAEDQQQRLCAPHILFNANSLYNIKFISSCLTGAVAGIIGLENWLGFFLFLFTTLFTSVVLHFVNLKAQPKKYFQGGFLEVVNPGQENTFSFILVWTLFYGSSLLCEGASKWKAECPSHPWLAMVHGTSQTVLCCAFLRFSPFLVYD